jgi:hypothetical protein
MKETIIEINRLIASIKTGCEKLKGKTSNIPIDVKALETWKAFWDMQRSVYLISERFHAGISKLCEKLDKDYEELHRMREKV